MPFSYQPQDSLVGPTLDFNHEELEKLDASQIEEYEVPSLKFDSFHDYKNLEASINNTINALNTKQPFVNSLHNENKERSNNTNYKNNNLYSNNHQPNVPQFEQPNEKFNNQGRNANNLILTPPSSGKIYNDSLRNHENDYERFQNNIDINSNFPNSINNKAQEQAEIYRNQLLELKKDLGDILKRHEHVINMKESLESDLKREISRLKRELRCEKQENARNRESIHNLRDQLRNLDIKLNNQGLGEYSYANDAKISNLVKQFEKEKSAAMEILKSKMKSEVNLLIPKIRDQIKQIYHAKLTESKVRTETYWQRKLDNVYKAHEMERRSWQSHLQAQIESDRKRVVSKLKSHFELKLLDVKNECERKVLDRLKNRDHSNRFDDNFSLYHGY